MISYPTSLSTHFSFAEGVSSKRAEEKGIRNLPEDEVILSNMVLTAGKMELVRTILNQPIHVDSWFRCLDLNHSLGSRDTSDHIIGCAVDFICPDFGPPVDICRKLIEHQDTLAYKQLILEHTWVHISFDPNPNVTPRLQVLSLLNSGTYAVGLTNAAGKYYA